ncbi:hypothetical protein CVT26_000824 [Gymnopilus dilepis]|uniref:Glutamyl-tRNA amidotransferase complex subunit Gta3 domain-containing protein n=1 Tax=Gymnopilus dilepis TaxID=231916 RepID=A0A409YLB1_9AGAR|nr:hypothetical protein CVT26_000824 [Gymnopilus dilepis]
MRLSSRVRPLAALSRTPARTASFSPRRWMTGSSGIPERPAWSVDQLLSSYPSPTLTSTTVNHLHELSALSPPQDKTEYQALQKELEELVRLVEAVKLVDTAGVEMYGRGELADADRQPAAQLNLDDCKQNLLRNAARTQDQVYVVHSERRR